VSSINEVIAAERQRAGKVTIQSFGLNTRGMDAYYYYYYYYHYKEADLSDA